jgi:hypothetical protein
MAIASCRSKISLCKVWLRLPTRYCRQLDNMTQRLQGANLFGAEIVAYKKLRPDAHDAIHLLLVPESFEEPRLLVLTLSVSTMFRARNLV